jgi:hypothetical protein
MQVLVDSKRPILVVAVLALSSVAVLANSTPAEGSAGYLTSPSTAQESQPAAPPFKLTPKQPPKATARPTVAAEPVVKYVVETRSIPSSYDPPDGNPVVFTRLFCLRAVAGPDGRSQLATKTPPPLELQNESYKTDSKPEHFDLIKAATPPTSQTVLSQATLTRANTGAKYNPVASGPSMIQIHSTIDPNKMTEADWWELNE